MLSRQYFDGIDATKKKHDPFRSTVSTIACVFVGKIEDDVSKQIHELLTVDW